MIVKLFLFYQKVNNLFPVEYLTDLILAIGDRESNDASRNIKTLVKDSVLPPSQKD